ncbi:MAG: hypothetical protein LBJ12_04320 [Oscillospiraceae bacterium]|jgi:hypothetical protein|nr:hypothetical protein [Oscillospiraceae bacterium]
MDKSLILSIVDRFTEWLQENFGTGFLDSIKTALGPIIDYITDILSGDLHDMVTG